MIDLGSDSWNGFAGMFVPAAPGSARRAAQVNQCIKKNLICEYRDRCCPCSSTKMCPFKDQELSNDKEPYSDLLADTNLWLRSPEEVQQQGGTPGWSV